ncbi:helix-turn-helix domain-containing protein [Actinoallomurus vinaceus]|uniref:Helix-turn-helix domain-containing protein n=1 Tax=Actinoallomurus vinaceus TaxID=1080074 RepID=A0ABP8U6J0_9ACTN
MAHEVVVLALDDVVAFDLGVPSQIFGAARDGSGRPLYRVRVCTPDGGPVRTSAGFAAVPDHGPEVLATADTVVIPGVHGGTALETGVLEPSVADALARRRPGTRVMSICTGAFVLAAAGLLDGRPATTHWLHAERFRALHPTVRLDPGVLFVDDGDVLTSAGVGAGVDVCLHVIRRDHGSAVANRAARRSVMPPWREGGQSQFIERPLPETTGSSTAETRAWALERLHEPLDLARLARRAGMSVRTFTRRFRAETGLSPAQWLVRQRIEEARRLLETTDLPIDQVAARAGLGTAASLRQHLHAAVGISPATYRRTFGASAV